MKDTMCGLVKEVNAPSTPRNTATTEEVTDTTRLLRK